MGEGEARASGDGGRPDPRWGLRRGGLQRGRRRDARGREGRRRTGRGTALCVRECVAAHVGDEGDVGGEWGVGTLGHGGEWG